MLNLQRKITKLRSRSKNRFGSYFVYRKFKVLKTAKWHTFFEIFILTGIIGCIESGLIKFCSAEELEILHFLSVCHENKNVTR